MSDADWDDFLERWRVLVRGLADRMSAKEVEETEYEGIQDACYGISGLLGGHEQGMWDLTAEEEDEAWALATLNDCDDSDLMNEWVRARSVRNRPIRRVRPKYPLAGGGHGPGRGKPGKSEFPAAWSEDAAIDAVMDVARRPDGAVQLPSGDFRAWGERDGVLVAAVVDAQGEVRTGYPVRGPGVIHNPLDDHRTPAVERLHRLLDALVPPGEDEPRRSLDELMSVGEWPHVVRCLQALHGSSPELDDLARLARL